MQPHRDVEVTGRRLGEDARLLRVAGEFDAGAVPELDGAADEALAAGVSRLVVDLSATRFLDSFALAALVRCSRRLRSGGCLLIVVTEPRASQPTAKFDLSGTRHFFHLCRSTEEALEVHAGPEPAGIGRPPADVVHLRLYVNGVSPHATEAVAAIDELRAASPPGARLEVVDVHERPDVAEREGVLATPLLVRLAPEPVRRIAGDMRDVDAVLEALDLSRTRP